MLKHILIVAILIIGVFSTAVVSASEMQNHTESDANMGSSLLDLFRDAGTGFHVLSEEVTQYLKACCNDRAAVEKLLRENGFDLTVITDPDPQQLSVSISQTGIQHDSLVSGERTPGLLRFWQFTTKYRVEAYFLEDQFVSAYAVVETTWP